MKKKFMAIILMVAIPAICATVSNTKVTSVKTGRWSSGGQVEKYVYFEIDKSMTVSNCNGSGASRIWIDMSDDYGKAVLSTVLTAKTTGSEINVTHYSNCSSYDSGDYVGLTQIELK